MFGRKKATHQTPALYATRSEFCRIFEKDMSSLYLLSFLLTADRTIAEQCLVGGLHIAQDGSRVFKEWAESWARRAIIQNAIRMIRPRKIAENAQSTADPMTVSAQTKHLEMAGVVDLPAFDRFAFVMSVLERYSDQECSLLLGCSRGEVAEARTRALEHLGKFADLRSKLVSIGSSQNMRRDASGSERPFTVAPSLAAFA